MEKKYNELTCNKCGWVHFGVTSEYADAEVKRFNEMYNELTAAEKERYYGSKPASMISYENCSLCGNSYKNFRESKESDCPTGVTLGPIIYD